MSSEPPFDHPDDPSKYGPTPTGPRSVPWMLTSGFKLGCAGVLCFLLTACCLFGAIEEANKRVLHRMNGLERRFDALEQKLDDMKKNEK